MSIHDEAFGLTRAGGINGLVAKYLSRVKEDVLEFVRSRDMCFEIIDTAFIADKDGNGNGNKHTPISFCWVVKDVSTLSHTQFLKNCALMYSDFMKHIADEIEKCPGELKNKAILWRACIHNNDTREDKVSALIRMCVYPKRNNPKRVNITTGKEVLEGEEM